MSGNAGYKKARYAIAQPATSPEITDGDFSLDATSFLLGPLADGSDIPDPDVEYDPFAGGRAEAAASQSIPLRILGNASLTEIQTAKGANPPSEFRLYVTNFSLTGYTRYGPGSFDKGHPQGSKVEARRQAIMTGFFSEGDSPEDFIVDYDEPVTLPA